MSFSYISILGSHSLKNMKRSSTSSYIGTCFLKIEFGLEASFFDACCSPSVSLTDRVTFEIPIHEMGITECLLDGAVVKTE